MKLLPVSEFSNCKNPLTARAAFYLDGFLEDIGNEYGYSVTSIPSSVSVENSVVLIDFVDYKTNTHAKFCLTEKGEIIKITGIKHQKTGRKVFNDDIQILDEIETIYELDSAPCGVVEGFSAALGREDGLESIACQAIMIIEEAIN